MFANLAARYYGRHTPCRSIKGSQDKAAVITIEKATYTKSTRSANKKSGVNRYWIS